MADPKEIVLEFIQSKAKQKSKFYFNDLAALFPDLKMRDAKKIINQLVSDGVLEYWSSGSTTMYGVPGAGKQAATEGED
jgi:Dissimilatory sulfite reductase D (DsrD)